MSTRDTYLQLADRLDRARQIVVLTGAGISTESGIPDFRGPQGVYTQDPTAEMRATIQHYVTDAEHRRTVWRNRARGEVFGGEPNPDTARSPSSNGTPRSTRS